MKVLTQTGIFFLFFLTVGFCNGQERKVIFLDNGKFSYSGFINEKDPVQLDLTILEDNTAVGDIKYLNRKNPMPIKLIGNFNNSEEYIYLLREFENDGNVTGFIRLKFDEHQEKLIGEWSSVKPDISYSIDLTLKDHFFVKPTVWGTYKFEGVYTYHYGKTGFDGVIELTKEKNGSYAYSMGTVTGEATRGWATVNGTGLVIKDNQCVIEVNKTCRFKADFYDGFLRISAIDEKLSNCGFTGPNTTLQGTYIKAIP